MDSFNSLDSLKELPQSPGIYKMFSGDGKLIYVGKARDLKKRVSSYFQKNIKDTKTQVLINSVKKIKVIKTSNETQALLLEAELIKREHPKFNITLRDDKSYPYIFLSTEEPFPQLSYIRRNAIKKGRYFGPYPNADVVRETLRELTKVFRLRTCKDNFFKHRTRPCLQYQIKRCSAPCVGFITQTNYQKDVKHALLFLDGKNKAVLQDLKKNMKEASYQLHFEEAAEYRDRIIKLQKFLENLRAIKKNLIVKPGKIEIRRDSLISNCEAAPAAEAIQTHQQWIDGFDVSHLSGTSTVASCVVFKDGQPNPSEYRRYNIKNIQKGDDYAALRQALFRRYKKLLENSEHLPDLILIDGGIGQLHQAEQVLAELEITGVELIAVAKGANRKPGYETLLFSGRDAPLQLPKDSPALHFIQSIRDEAHRFAYTSHRKRREKLAVHSVLENIPQVGPKRRRSLLNYFGGLQALNKANVDAILKVPGIPANLAKKIYQVLQT